MTRFLIASMVAFAVLVALVLFTMIWPSRAGAHEAPTGWSYDAACCNTRDCAPIETVFVEIRADGYHVTIPGGAHTYVPETRYEFLPWGDRRLRRSGDEFYHACVTPGGSFLCLYTPDMGA